MASWIIVPCLLQLRKEFNAIAPGRDKASDGGIGDTAHQANSSDHNADEVGNVPIRDADRTNEVHAIDVDVDLRTPGLSMEKVVQFILARCRSGKETRLRYIIYNRRIWSASSGWVQKAYTGSNPHDHHAHFSASYVTAKEYSTATWHLSELLPKEEPPVTNPNPPSATAAEIADAVAGKKLGADGQALGNRIIELDVRSDYLANRFAQDVQDRLGNLEGQLAEIKSLLTSPPAAPPAA